MKVNREIIKNIVNYKPISERMALSQVPEKLIPEETNKNDAIKKITSTPQDRTSQLSKAGFMNPMMGTRQVLNSIGNVQENSFEPSTASQQYKTVQSNMEKASDGKIQAEKGIPKENNASLQKEINKKSLTGTSTKVADTIRKQQNANTRANTEARVSQSRRK